ncbi:14772_t:CDS:1, partial [Gigaspora margarita]
NSTANIMNLLHCRGIKCRAHHADDRVVFFGKYETLNFIIHYVKRDRNSIGMTEVNHLITDLDNQQSEYVGFFLTNNEYSISAINLAAMYSNIFLCHEGTIVDKIKDAARAKVVKGSSRSDVIMKGIKIDKEKNVFIDEILMKDSDFRPF